MEPLGSQHFRPELRLSQLGSTGLVVSSGALVRTIIAGLCRPDYSEIHGAGHVAAFKDPVRTENVPVDLCVP
jgi:hypothetical protein